MNALKILPALLEEVDENEYSPDFLKNELFQDMGVALQVAECSCGAIFSVNKSVPGRNCRCPWDYFAETHLVSVTKQTAAVLNEALAGSQTKGGVIVGNTVTLQPGQKPHKKL
jgi:hypothetical protein